MAGRSLLPLLRGEAQHWEDVAFSEFCVEEGWFHRMVRSGEWKLVHYHRHRPQLFDLAADPDELRDLGEDPRYAAVRQHLTERVLDGWDPDAIETEWRRKREQAVLYPADAAPRLSQQALTVPATVPVD